MHLATAQDPCVYLLHKCSFIFYIIIIGSQCNLKLVSRSNICIISAICRPSIRRSACHGCLWNESWDEHGSSGMFLGLHAASLIIVHECLFDCKIFKIRNLSF